MAGPTPRKRTAPKKAPSAPSPAAAPAAVADTRSLNQWLRDITTGPLRVEVFDRWWELKQPTSERAHRWNQLMLGGDVRGALASMMFDEAAAPDLTWTDDEGEHTQPSPPGSAVADEFLTVASSWVPARAAVEFWNRLAGEIFDVGEALAS